MLDNSMQPNNERPLHQGKWTPEEDEYVNCLIEEFKAGLLPLAEGTSLRIFLSKMLNCHPMRISKKFVGSNYNGKQVYVRKSNNFTPEEVRERRERLMRLERKFLAKLSPSSALDAPQGMGGGKGGPFGADAGHGVDHGAAVAGLASGKQLETFSSAELAAELQKRANLERLIAKGSGNDLRCDSLSDLANAIHSDSIPLAGGLGSLAALSKHAAGGSALSFSNLLDNHASVNSFSNLSNYALKAKLQSLSSMGSLKEGALNMAAGGTAMKNWTPGVAGLTPARVSTSSMTSAGNSAINMNMLGLNVPKVSTGSMSASSTGAASRLDNMRFSMQEELNRSGRVNKNSLESLLRGDSFLNRSLEGQQGQQNWNEQEGIKSDIFKQASAMDQISSQSDDSAIAQYLYQKKLAEQAVDPTSDLLQAKSFENSLLGSLRNISGQETQEDQILMNNLKRKLLDQERAVQDERLAKRFR